ncbi:MAG: glucosamine--fructose-6-phosphate aminotransferase (isomerizing) [Gammaproteobacteria bacterium]|jgi:glucosamine--fructose-6-phosphate aminotransferase (isomerizing)
MSLMLQEANEAPSVVAHQFASNQVLFEGLAAHFKRHRPRFIATCARGSSNHAATYAKYLIETRLGVPVLSWAPSVASVYGATVDMSNSLMLCISQSGESFDLVESARWAKLHGAWVVSLLNTPDSPLGAASDVVVPLLAGVETSVASTKAHIASLSAVFQLVAHASDDCALLSLQDNVPAQLEAAAALDWSKASEALGACGHAYVVGRGLGLGAAREAALKFKEACGLHAEAFSAAELMHGPVALLADHYPVLLFALPDETRLLTEQLAQLLRKKGVVVFAAGESDIADGRADFSYRLPVVAGVHPTIAPLTLTQACYGLVDLVAKRRGRDPDHPALLSKVTRTR